VLGIWLHFSSGIGNVAFFDATSPKNNQPAGYWPSKAASPLLKNQPAALVF